MKYHYSYFTNESQKLGELPKVTQLLVDKIWVLFLAYLTLKLILLFMTLDLQKEIEYSAM